MTRSIKRFFCFAGAVAAGVVCFGLWSANVQAFTGGGGTPPCSTTSSVSMCYTPTHTTVLNVPPATQSTNLSTGKYTCGACATSGS
ncbi:MAG TPA: hypothetical protein VK961_21815 [Chthoniobacter sp.]|nr:hypothetical protein [Chthoniobacter sp.]